MIASSRALAAAWSGLAVVALGVWLLAWWQAPAVADLAWLLAATVGATTVLGGLGAIMVCEACGALWFVAVRRSAELVASALPIALLLLLPLAAMRAQLYPWARPWTQLPPAAVASLVHRQAWLQPLPMLLRVVVCFACWLALSEGLLAYARWQDRRPGSTLASARRWLSAGGLLPLAFTVTALAVDWIMGRDVRWASTMAGLVVLVGAFCAGVALDILVLEAWIARRRLEDPGDELRHYLGKVLFAGITVWAYIVVMQALVIWMGDLPDESAWLLPRCAGAWGWLGGSLIVLHFVLPFALLLSRRAKRSRRMLALSAGIVLVAHGLDLAWQVLPASDGTPEGAVSGLGGIWSWFAYPAALLAVGGASAAFATWRGAAWTALPSGDGDVADALHMRSEP